jgi:glycosyltransferase involved in cell wall biosynthesis
MRIVFGKGVLQGPISGADEILTANAAQLQQAGHTVSVLLMYPHTLSDQYYLRLREAGVSVASVASPGMRHSLNAGRRLARRLLEIFPASQNILRQRAQKIATGIASRYYDQCYAYFKEACPDLVHIITPDPSAMVMIRAAHAAGIPVLYQEVGTPFHPPGYEPYYEQFTTVLPLCAEVTALSPQLARECREKLPAANISVLPILIDEEFNRAATNGRRHRNGNVTFGFAARLEHLKGPLALIDAFASAQQKFRDIKLRIAGDGSLKQKVIARAKTHRVARQCEFAEIYTLNKQKIAFMQSLDVFVLPSLTEGTPNGIIEAMAHGLPIISTTVGGVPDLVTDETGILVPPGDTEALARAMSRLAEDPHLRARMGHAARERYEKLFNPALVLTLMLDTYKRVAGRNGNHAPQTSPNGDGSLHPWANEGMNEGMRDEG